MEFQTRWRVALPLLMVVTLLCQGAIAQPNEMTRTLDTADDQIKRCVAQIRPSLEDGGNEELPALLLSACSMAKGNTVTARHKLLKGLKTNRPKKPEVRSLATHLVPCRSGTWKLSRARSLKPIANKAQINSKILEACVNVDFSPEHALKKVEATYFAENNRVSRQRANQKTKDEAKPRRFAKLRKLLPKFRTKSCPEKLKALMTPNGLKTQLGAEALDRRLADLCELADQDVDEALQKLKTLFKGRKNKDSD